MISKTNGVQVDHPSSPATVVQIGPSLHFTLPSDTRHELMMLVEPCLNHRLGVCWSSAGSQPDRTLTRMPILSAQPYTGVFIHHYIYHCCLSIWILSSSILSDFEKTLTVWQSFHLFANMLLGRDCRSFSQLLPHLFVAFLLFPKVTINHVVRWSSTGQ